jgi:hypothetical protein
MMKKVAHHPKDLLVFYVALPYVYTLFVNSYSHGDIKPSESLVNAVAMLAFGCLGLSSIDKIWSKRDHNKTEE